MRFRLRALLCVVSAGLSGSMAGADSPPLPHSLYGEVTSSAGGASLSGSRVSARVEGVEVSSGVVFEVAGHAAFAILVPGDLPESPEVEGAVPGQQVELRVGGATVDQSALWAPGVHQQLDLEVPAGADLSIQIDDGIASIYPGFETTYVMSISNRSDVAATGVELRFLVPENTSMGDLDGGVLGPDGTVGWAPFEVPAGATVMRRVGVAIATVLPQGVDSIVATATAAHDGSTGVDPDSSNNRATDRNDLEVPPDFAVAPADFSASPERPTAGELVSLSLTVHNIGFVAGTTPVAIYEGRPGLGRLLATRTVTVPAGGSAQVSSVFVASESTVLVSALVDPFNTVDELDETNNRVERFLVDAPDLAISLDNVLLSHPEPRAGDTVEVTVVVRNAGNRSAVGASLEVFAGDPEFGSPLLFAQALPEVPAGGNRAVRFPWTVVEGVTRLTAIVDRLDLLVELSEENNRAELQVVVPRAAGPDLVIAAMDASGLVQSPQTLLATGEVIATVENRGDAVSGPFVVALFEDRDGDGRASEGDQVVARQEVSGLAASAAVPVVFSLQRQLRFFHPSLRVEVDVDHQIDELDEDNNVAAVFANCTEEAVASFEPIEEKWWVPGLEAETAPLVVHLNDDNGDGRIDSRDIPDVLFHTEDSLGRGVTARSGLDGSEHWTFRSSASNPLAGRLAHLAAADLDGDGVVEIVAIQSNGRLLALDVQGRILWVSDRLTGGAHSDWAGGPTIGDLDGDGTPEIVVGRVVLDHQGRLIGQGSRNQGRNHNYYGPFGQPWPWGIDQHFVTIADVDLDGQAELLAGDTVYRLVDGQLQVVWDHQVLDNLMVDGFSVAANLDGDPTAEIVYVSSGRIMVFNHNGSIFANHRRFIPLHPLLPPTFWGGPPTVADLDGDGVPEILVAGDTELVAMRANLSVLWRKAIDERAAFTSPTVFDLDGDGFPEVLYLDQTTFWILDGRTGAVRYSRPNTSKTATESAVVADVDGDGRADILLPSNRSFGGNTSTQGMHLLSSPGWVGSRSIWNQHEYDTTSVLSDGTIPSPATPHWLSHNRHRANVELPRSPLRRPNLTVGLPRVGAAMPSGVPITIRVGNGGDRLVAPGAVVRFFAGEDATGPLAVEAQTTRVLSPGSFEDLTVLWQASGPAGSPAFVLVDPDNVVDECHESDNGFVFPVTETVLPDLVAVPGSVVVPAMPIAGQHHTVEVTIANRGPARSEMSLLRLWDGDPVDGGVIAGDADVPALDPGATISVSVSWDTFGAAGTRELHFQADALDAVFELDEDNNRISTTIALLEPEHPDLSIEAFVVSPSSVDAGQQALLEVEILNRGDEWVAGFEVSFRRNAAELVRLQVAGPWPSGERRVVSLPLDTIALLGQVLLEARIDPAGVVTEENESNNHASVWLEVRPAPLSAGLATDRVGYRSHEDVVISIEATNTTGEAREVVRRVEVRDANDARITLVEEELVLLSPGPTSSTLVWSTGAHPAGTYSVLVELEQGGSVVARARSPFSIAPDRKLRARVLTDRSSYPAESQVLFSASIENEGVNDVVVGLVGRIEVTDGSGTQVFTESRTVPDLAAGESWGFAATWAIGLTPPGSHTARLTVRDAGGLGELLAYDEVVLVVEDSSETGAGLLGRLVVLPTLVGSGAPVLLAFDVTNSGNADAPGLVAAIRVEHLLSGEDVFSQLVPLPLLRGESGAREVVFDTESLAPATYSVSLSAIVPAGALVLDRADLDVELGLRVQDVEVAEGHSGSTTVSVAVQLSGPSVDPVSVAWSTADGTAVAGSDYLPNGGVIQLQPGEVEALATVVVLGDLEPELGERLIVSLSNPTGAGLADAQGLVTILDDDGCASAELLVDPGLELGPGSPSWTIVSGAWRRGFAAPAALEGSFMAAAEGEVLAELRQDVDMSPFAVFVDGANLELDLSAFLAGPEGGATAAIVLELLDGAGQVIGSVDSGELELAAAWSAWSATAPVPVGTRAARFRLLSPPGDVASSQARFDLLSLRVLGAPSLSVTAPSVSEGDVGNRPATFELRLSCPAPAAFGVDYRTVAISATPGVDFVPIEGTLTFAAGDLVRTLDVEVIGDLLDEPDERFALVVSTEGDVAVLDPAPEAVILDDDGLVGLTIGDVSLLEGDAGLQDAVFTVELAGPSGKHVSVGYRIVGVTATPGIDFHPAVGRLELAPGVVSGEVVVAVVGDGIDELDETFHVELFDPIEAEIARAAGVGTILDDDESHIAIAPVAVAESEGPARFPVTLSHPSSREVRVDFATEDVGATAGEDYVATAGTLVFPPGTVAGVVEVEILDDAIEEPYETFRVELTNPVEAGLAMPEALGTILDDDGVVITIADVVVQEGDEGTTSAVFRLSFSRVLPEPVSIGYRTVDGSTVAGSDYLETSGVLLAPAGVSFAEIVVPVVGDLVEEPLETFTLELFDAEGGVVVDPEAVGTILDNDGWRLNGHAEDLSRPGCIVLTPATRNRRGSAWRTERVSLTESFDKTFRVYFGTNDGNGSDGIMFVLQDVGLDALGGSGGLMGYAGIDRSVGVEMDTWRNTENGVEPTWDHIAVNLNGQWNHNGHPPVPATPDAANIEDGLEHVMRVVWNDASQALDIHFDDIERLVYSRDLVTDVFEGEESVYFGLTAGTGAPVNVYYFCETAGCYQGTGPSLLSAGDAHVTEGDVGSRLAHFPITLACPRPDPVEVRFTTVDGTAVGTSDYVPAAGIVRFEPGETSKTISVQVLGDLEPEPDEVFFLRLSDPVGAEIRYAEGVGTIRSDEFEISAASTSIVESGLGETWTVPISISLNTPATVVTRVNYQTVAGTATAGVDFTATSGQVTFQIGETNKTVNVSVRGDDIPEADESFSLVLSNPVGATLGENATVVILDDDSCPGGNLLVNPSAELAAPAGSIPGWIQVAGAWRSQLGGSHGGLVWPIARDGAHFFYAGDVAFGELYQDVDVSPLAWWIDEGGARFEAKGFLYSWNDAVMDSARLVVEYRDSSAQILGLWDTGEARNSRFWGRHAEVRAAPVGTRQIRMRLMSTRYSSDQFNDAYYDQLSLRALGFPFVSVHDTSVLEEETGTTTASFRVTQNCSVPFPTSVDYLTVDATALAGSDYVAAFGRLAFAPGEVEKTIDVTILGDSIPEPDETFSLRLVSPVNAAIDRAEAIGTIRADEVEMSIGAVTLPEGDSGFTPFVFPVSLSDPSPLPISVSWATGGETPAGTVTATEGADYLPGSGTLHFAPGEIEQNITVLVAGDSEVEPDETFRVALSNPVNAVLIEDRGYGTIVQDDLSIQIHEGSAIEGDAGTTALVMRVSLDGPSTAPMSVDWATRDGSAEAGLDYIAASGTVTFAAGSTETVITVQVIGDTEIEPSETVIVSLSNPSAGEILVAEAVGIILDDDDCPSPELLINASGDDAPVSGQLPGWTQVVGTGWTRRTSNPTPLDGSGYFYPGSVATGELRQEVDLGAYASFVDAGIQRIQLRGFLRSQSKAVPDVGRLVVEYVDQDGVVLSGFDSGPVAAVGTWRQISDLQTVPPGTRLARVRLLAQRTAASGGNEVFFDAVSLRTLAVPVLVMPTTLSAREGLDQHVEVPVSLSCQSDQTLTVYYEARGLTATGGSDFVATSGTLTFLPAETEKLVVVEILDDPTDEATEELEIVLSESSYAPILVPRAVLEILDDDPTPMVSISDATVVEGDEGLVAVDLVLTASNPTDRLGSVRARTLGGTAFSGVDFEPVDQVVVFGPGETTKTVTVQVGGDIDHELDEAFELWLSEPSHLLIGRAAATITIIDDDGNADCLAPSLLRNGGAEVGVTGWTAVSGTWTGRLDPGLAFEGRQYLFAGNIANAELYQDVDLSSYAAWIDSGTQEWEFEGFLRSRDENNPDRGRVVVEYRDAANTAVLSTFDSGQIADRQSWQRVSDRRVVPIGTRWARVRLLAQRFAGSPNDAYFDALSLRSVGTPALFVTDAQVVEPDSGLRPVAVDVRLSCPAAEPIEVVANTLDGTATAPADYLPHTESVHFAPGVTRQTLEMQVVGDLVAEAEEHFTVELSEAIGAPSARAQAEVTVFDTHAPLLDLVHCVDGSGSINATGWNLQREGIARSVEDPLLTARNGSVRVTVVQFAAAARLEVEPTLVVDESSATQLAARIRAMPQLGGGTNIEACLRLAMPTVLAAVPRAAKRVVDLSTDGVSGGNPILAVSELTADGLDVVNAIGVGSGVDQLFLDRVVWPQPAGGPEGFVILAADFQEYVDAIAAKVRTETAPDLVVTKTDGLESIVAGAATSYTISVTNLGSGAASNLFVDEALPAALGQVQFVPSIGTYDPATGLWSGFLLDTGDSATLRVDGLIDPAATGVLINTVTVHPPTGTIDLDPSNNSATDTTLVLTQADLALSKTGPLELPSGGLARYQLVVTNHGPSDAVGPVEVRDVPPEGLVWLGGSGDGWSCSEVASELVCVHAGPLPASASLPPLEVTAEVHAAPGSQLVNQATVHASAEDPVPANNSASHLAQVRHAELLVEKTVSVVAPGSEPATGGDILAYSVLVQNVGEIPLTELEVWDEIPSHTTLIPGSLTSTQGTVVSTSPAGVEIGALAPGETAEILFEVEITDPVAPGVEYIANQATVSSAELPDELSDDPSTPEPGDATRVAVDGSPELLVTKTATLFADLDGDSVPSPGDELEYHLVVHNVGGGRATDIRVFDATPQHTTLVPGSVVASAGFVASEDPVEVLLPQLERDGLLEITFRVAIDGVLPAGVDRVSNQAVVTSTELPAVLSDDPDVGGEADPTVTLVSAAPRLLAEKTWVLADDADEDGVASPGDTLTYEIRLANLGTVGATEVVFEDLTPEHTTAVIASATTSAGTILGEDPLRVEVDTLEVGDEVLVSFSVLVDALLPAGVDEVSNQGFLASAETDVVLTDDPALAGEADPTVTPVAAAPKLRLEKVDVLVDRDGDALASPGDELIYLLTLDNDGNTAATGLLLRDPIPAFTTLVAGSVVSSAGTVLGEDPIELELDDLVPGVSVELSFRVAVPPGLPAEVVQLENQATIEADGLAIQLSDDPRLPGIDDPTVTAVTHPPRISIADSSALENAGTITFVVSLSHAATIDLVVPWSTADIDAIAGLDYVAATGQLEVPAGETSGSLVITVIDDLLDEPNETFQLSLGTPSYGQLERAAAIGTIIDDDEAPQLVIAGGQVLEGNSGTVDLNFTLALSAPSGRPVTVSYTTADGSATVGADYLATSGSVVFQVGETVRVVSVLVLGDLIDEVDETVRLVLLAVEHATAVTNEATGTIVDDDVPGISIGDVAVLEGDSGTVDAVFPVTLSLAGRLPIEVAVQTEEDTATAGLDYQPVSGSLTFFPGEVEHELRVPVVGDVVLEADETFRVLLASPSYGELVRAVGLGTILDDEVCLGPNLLENPGAEEPEVEGVLPEWRVERGAGWSRATTVTPREGQASFTPLPLDPGAAPFAELVQDVDVRPYASLIDGGDQRFAFEVWLLSADLDPSDLAQVILEYRSQADGPLLGSFESEDLVSTSGWSSLIEVAAAPTGTRWIRVRLIAERRSIDGPWLFFDDLMLASLRAATLTVGDASVLEGDSGATELRFPVRLACPLPEPVALGYTTTDGTATVGEDYQSSSGTLTLAAGETETELPVIVFGDTVVEPDETVLLELDLVGETSAVLLNSEATGTIVNDDDGGGTFCPRSPGYWKNHVSAWPVATLLIGAINYDVPGALALLQYGGPDSATKLGRALVATKLNQASGYDAPGLASLVADADVFLTTHPPGSNPKGAARNTANALKDALEVHYQGECPDPPWACSPAPLGIATGWNVFVRGTLAQNYSDTEGRMAAGGAVQLNGYSVGLLEPVSPGTPVLVAGGHLLFVNGTASGGDIVYGLSAQTASLNVPHGVIRQGTVIDFAAAGLELEGLAAALAALPQNGTVTIPPWNTITLDGSDPERNVFTLTAAQLQATSSVTIRVPAQSTVVVNVTGSAAVMQYFGFTLDGASRERILWNFPQATSLTMQGVGVEGSVLAPRAAVQFNNGVIHGSLVASSLQGNGQSNRVAFGGCLPSP